MAGFLVLLAPQAGVASKAVDPHDGFEAFSRNVDKLVNDVHVFCQINLDLLTVEEIVKDGVIQNKYDFRNVCGKNVNGSEIAKTAYKYYYFNDGNRKQFQELIGIEQKLTYDDQEYMLIIGKLSDVKFNKRFKKNKEPKYQEYTVPIAVLFHKKEEKWMSVWNFVNPVLRRWQLPNDFSLSKYTDVDEGTVDWFKSVLVDYIQRDFANLMQQFETRELPSDYEAPDFLKEVDN